MSGAEWVYDAEFVFRLVRSLKSRTEYPPVGLMMADSTDIVSRNAAMVIEYQEDAIREAADEIERLNGIIEAAFSCMDKVVDNYVSDLSENYPRHDAEEGEGMTKPYHPIPSDIQEIVYSILVGNNQDNLGLAISKAIMAAKAEEREQAARIAESYDGAGLAGTYGMELGDASRTMDDIANAIRNRDTV